MKVWLLRHAESEWNAAGRWQGHGDPPLSEAGRAAAETCAPSIAASVASGERPVRIHCSDLRRAVETAGCVARALDVEPIVVPELRELDVGRWTGLRRSEIEATDGPLLAAFESDDRDVRPGGGETRRELGARVRDAALRLAEGEPEADLLLVVHLGVVRELSPGTEAEHLELVGTDPESIRRARSDDGPTRSAAGPRS